jgi:hypothetical protein
MKRLSMFALLLGLAGVLGCEPPKPAAKEAPKATDAATDAAPATDGAPATDAPKEDMPKEEETK